MLWNLLTAGIFGTDYYIKKKINTSEKKDLKEKCLGGRLIVRNCHNHGMMLGILKNKDKEFLRDLASMVLGGAIWEYIRTSGEKGTRISKLGLSMILGGGGLELTTEYLGNKVVCHSLPIRPGRNLAIIVETAAVNHRQKKMGYNAAQELYRRVQENLTKKSDDEEDE